MTHTSQVVVGLIQGAFTAALLIATFAAWIWWQRRDRRDDDDDDDFPPQGPFGIVVDAEPFAVGFHRPEGVPA